MSTVQKASIRSADAQGRLAHIKRKSFAKYYTPFAFLIIGTLANGVPIDGWSQMPIWQPERNIEFVVPAGPGGSNDTIARVVKKILEDQRILDASITVLNKPGGGQTIAMTYLGQHSRDAHFVAFGSATMVTNSILTGRDVFSNVDPLALLISEYVAFAVKTQSPIKTTKELLAGFRQNPGSISIGIASAKGNHNHIAPAMVVKALGGEPKQLKVVVFKTSTEAITAVLGGHVDLVVTPPSNLVTLAQSGAVRIIAIAAPRRLADSLANVPTLTEHGMNVVVNGWRTVVGPKGLTIPQRTFWERLLEKVSQTQEWNRFLQTRHWKNEYMAGRETENFIQRERENYRGILGDLGLVK